jgi:hypothetical protein
MGVLTDGFARFCPEVASATSGTLMPFQGSPPSGRMDDYISLTSHQGSIHEQASGQVILRQQRSVVIVFHQVSAGLDEALLQARQRPVEGVYSTRPKRKFLLTSS